MLKKILLLLSLTLTFVFANGHMQHKMFQTVEAKEATLLKKDSSKMFCNNCGMHLTKYYKTSHGVELKNGKNEQYCSIHCLAETATKNKGKITKRLVVDTNSLKMIDATKAVYVVGSSKKGTMTGRSKYAFSNKANAMKFAKEFGGEIQTFNQAFKMAQQDLPMDNGSLTKKRTKMSSMGKKVYTNMCSKTDLPTFKSFGQAKKYLLDNKICENVKAKELQAVSIYLTKQYEKLETSIAAPNDAKCPVCGMFVAKFPKWAAIATTKDGHTHYFDGVKDLMKFYLNPSKFAHQHASSDFNLLEVNDFYNLHKLDARKAWYVIGSNVYGPMGEELIPFKTKKEAEAFNKSHYGKKILKFNEIKESMLY